jgi:4,5-DOPA dioxygenase extradiol
MSVALDGESWGIDHGAWSVLVHAFPEATIPVVQLSVHAGQPLAYHLELGARLAPLRQSGIAVIASGNIVHNLGMLDPGQPGSGFDWAHRFDDAARGHMMSKPGEIVSLGNHPDFRQAAPTPEHFIPLLYLAGLAEAAGTTADVLVDGYALGSLSMTSYVVSGSSSPPPGTQEP